MNFKESHKYLLEQSIFNRAILTCHCVQDGYAWLYETITNNSQPTIAYKYNIKKERMYVFNKAMQTWDSVDNYTIAEYSSNVSTGYESKNIY